MQWSLISDQRSENRQARLLTDHYH